MIILKTVHYRMDLKRRYIITAAIYSSYEMNRQYSTIQDV